MVGKRKIDTLRANIAKMARAADSDNKDDYRKACREVPNLLQNDPNRLLADGLTSQEYFAKLLRTATNMDRILEYLLFKRNLPELLPEVKLELDLWVRRELMVEEALANFQIEDLVTKEDGPTPLLDALGIRAGQPLAQILAPPTIDCLLCSRRLTKHNHPSTVACFSMEGPSLARKYTWR